MKKYRIRKSVAIIAASALTIFNLIGNSILSVNYVSAGQQLGQTDFEDGVGLPWHVCESQPGEMEFEISNGVYNITIVNPGGASRGLMKTGMASLIHRSMRHIGMFNSFRLIRRKR